MRRLDELYTAHPFLGSRRMITMRAEGLRINCKRVQRLMHGDKASDWEARWP